jgi:putative oxidoreductase
MMINNDNFWTNSDVGLLIVRIALGGIIFFHGFHKITHGVADQFQLLASNGIPGIFIYFVYVSEVLAPVLIVLGILTRLSNLTIIVTMIVVFYALPFPIGMDEHGAMNIESQLYFLLLSVALFFTGPGRYVLKKNNSGNWLLD